MKQLQPEDVSGRQKGTATVKRALRPFGRGAFLYPSTGSLRQRGYYSWPGVGFDAEGRQREYMKQIGAISQKLGMDISMNEKPLHDGESVTQFISEVKEQTPDGLLLIPFSKGDWGSVNRIIEEVGIPVVVLATIGVLLNPQINQLHRKPGVYFISSLDNLAAVEYGMRMIKTARWMKESRIVNVTGTETKETIVPNLGTQVRTIPLERYVEEFKQTETTDEVREIANTYLKNAKKVVEPSEADVIDAAKTSVVCKRIIAAEEADAFMMNCLSGISAEKPVPCMAYMSLRDEGIAMGCQSDLNATLTMMLVQQLFDRPGFQQNASSETEKNHYYGAHCTCTSKLNGTTESPEPYILRNHAETGTGVVPQVLWREGQEVTMAHYLAGETPQMIIYSGEVVGCYDMPPAGGCRTNVELTINEIDDVCDVKGMHQTIFYGSYARQLKVFCQLFGITVVT